ncbi:iron-containing alcohol dehydrogenase [Vibrio hannami]|uniref:iron-containing alcohol dehydrogenase n=1 Tax=Vibrio hannami TaxID=2717094 RepID=UPI00240FDEAF|nr:iron-containing alcohol dehydrogenase [Vibrio hannami]MDG3087884.1 iron-containing alcohol dehydrogenase [Vibrio hannami]
MIKIKTETSSKVIIGENSLLKVFDELPSGAKNIALVTGSHFVSSASYALLEQQCRDLKIKLNRFVVSAEPRVEVVDSIVDSLEEPQDLVLGIGGGSALDCAKAVAAMLTSEGGLERYLEGIGDLVPLPRKVPFYAIPTTSGTGSEATKNAVFIKQGKVSYKKSIRHDSYIPDVVILDPLLTLGCPPLVTAACGFDAIAQLLEAYISTKATKYTDEACLEGLQHAFDVFPIVCNDLARDIQAREKMAIASFLSGVGLANAGLVNVHGIAGPIGGEIDIPHGVAVAMIFPETLQLIVEKLPSECITREKLDRLVDLISDENDTLIKLQGSHKLIEFLKLSREKYLPGSLSDYGITAANIARIAKESADKNSPVHLSESEIIALLESRC